jgi:hypothetical protein
MNLGYIIETIVTFFFIFRLNSKIINITSDNNLEIDSTTKEKEKLMMELLTIGGMNQLLRSVPTDFEKPSVQMEFECINAEVFHLF